MGIKCKWCGWTPHNESLHNTTGDVKKFDEHLKICTKKPRDKE